MSVPNGQLTNGKSIHQKSARCEPFIKGLHSKFCLPEVITVVISDLYAISDAKDNRNNASKEITRVFVGRVEVCISDVKYVDDLGCYHSPSNISDYAISILCVHKAED